MVFRGLSTRRTRRDLMVLMSLPLVPLQGRKRHKNNRGNHFLPRSLTGIFVGIQSGFGGGIGRVWGCCDRILCPSSPELQAGWPSLTRDVSSSTEEELGQDRVLLAGLSHSCWPGFVTCQPLTRTWGPSCTDPNAPSQGSSSGTGAELLQHPIPGWRRDTATPGSSLSAG